MCCVYCNRRWILEKQGLNIYMYVYIYEHLNNINLTLTLSHTRTHTRLITKHFSFLIVVCYLKQEWRTCEMDLSETRSVNVC